MYWEDQALLHSDHWQEGNGHQGQGGQISFQRGFQGEKHGWKHRCPKVLGPDGGWQSRVWQNEITLNTNSIISIQDWFTCSTGLAWSISRRVLEILFRYPTLRLVRWRNWSLEMMMELWLLLRKNNSGTWSTDCTQSSRYSLTFNS